VIYLGISFSPNLVANDSYYLTLKTLTGNESHLRHERTRYMNSWDRNFQHHFIHYKEQTPQRSSWSAPRNSYEFLKRTYHRPLFRYRLILYIVLQLLSENEFYLPTNLNLILEYFVFYNKLSSSLFSVGICP